jgi:hypothetical protein
VIDGSFREEFIAVLYAEIRMEPEGREEPSKKGETANV